MTLFHATYYEAVLASRRAELVRRARTTTTREVAPGAPRAAAPATARRGRPWRGSPCTDGGPCAGARLRGTSG